MDPVSVAGKGALEPVEGDAMKTFAMFAVLSLAVAGAVGAADRSVSDAYLPGFGEFMSATQMRHAKLWFAGDAQNWDLAAFELDEIKEGLEDATRLHPTHEGIPVAAMIKANLDAPLSGLAKAVETQDRNEFTRAFDVLTAACNACHTAAAHAFIKIKRPTAPPVSNQDFAPASK
jgi:hypothetical protein